MPPPPAARPGTAERDTGPGAEDDLQSPSDSSAPRQTSGGTSESAD